MKDKEFERQFVLANERGAEVLDLSVKAISARYDRAKKRIVLELQNGATLLVPVNLIQGLQVADDKALADFELVLQGSQIHWSSLDVQMHIGSLIEGIFGTPSWMRRLREHYSAIGSKGGSTRTTATIAASRENGKKGGRPRKVSVR